MVNLPHVYGMRSYPACCLSICDVTLVDKTSEEMICKVEGWREASESKRLKSNNLKLECAACKIEWINKGIVEWWQINT